MAFQPIFWHNFEDRSSARWDAGTIYGIGTYDPKYGEVYASLDSSSYYLRKTIGPLQELYFSAWVKPGTTGGYPFIIYEGSDTFAITLIYITSSSVGSWLEYRIPGATGTVRTSKQLSPSTQWHHIQAHLKLGVDGVFEGKVGDVVEFSISGDYSGMQADVLQIGYSSGPGGVDNVVLGTGGYAGDLRIWTGVPNGNGSLNEWIPFSGANYENVDELPISISDYVATNEVGKKDLYTIPELPDMETGILGVMVRSLVGQDGATVPTGYRNIVRVDGADYAGDTNALAPSGIRTDFFQTNPATGLAWTKSDIAGLEIGVESLA